MDVLERWRGIGRATFRGLASLHEMKETLTAFGYSYRQVKGNRAQSFPFPRTDLAIVSVEWFREEGERYAGHYVSMKKLKDRWWVYCNGEGWFPADSDRGMGYLDGRGCVPSYLEVWKSEGLVAA